MELFKRILALVLCLVMCFALVACGSKKSEKDDDDDSKEESSEMESGDANCQHQWGDETNNNKKPCTEESEITHSCTLCGREEVVKVIPATGHKIDYSTNKCEVCGKKAKSSCTHDNCTWVKIEEPSCRESGYENQICDKCKFIQNTNYLPSLGHDYEYHDYKDATCTEDGNYGYDTCTRCDYSEYEGSVILATGHIYIAGICKNCSEKNSEYVLVDKVATNVNEHSVLPPVEAPFAEDDVILTESGEIKSNSDKKTYEFTAECDGVVYVWVSGVTDGVRFKLYSYNSSKTAVGENTYAANGDGFSFMATAGATYNIAVNGSYGASSFNLNVTKPKPILDVSAYNKVGGKILFNDHTITYTYTATVSGAHCFTFNDMDADSEVRVSIVNSENYALQNRTWLGGNYNYTVATLNAGETYTITVKESKVFTPFNMVINAPTAPIDISSFTAVKDNIYFVNQVNTYTFTANANGKVYFALSDMIENADLYIELFDHEGNRIDYDSYCDNGDSVSADLVAGQTYTVAVSHYYSNFSPYTLNIVTDGEKVALSSNNGYNDSFMLDGQKKVYTFTSTKEGDYIITISGMDEASYVSMEIFDSNGSEVDSDSYLKNGEYLFISDVAVASIYTIVVSENRSVGNFTISVETRR